jgi:hypothetical protein
MSDKRSQIEQEAQAHITLGILLQRHRTEEHKRAVQKVVDGNLATDRKIEEIRKLDAEYFGSSESASNESASHAAAPGAPSRPRRYGTEGNRRSGSHEHRIRAKHVVPAKAVLIRSSWLRYMFRNYRTIRSFGERTKTLRCRLFPPSIRLNGDLGAYIARTYQREAKNLWMVLNRVESEGWRYLTKRDYNLLMVFRRLANQLMNASFAFRRSDHSNVVDRYIRLENAYLILVSKPEYLDRIQNAFEELKNSTAELFPDDYEPTDKMKLLLTDQPPSPTFRDFIRAVNICKYRTYLELADLIRPDMEHPVAADAFDCSPSTANKILSHITTLQESLEQDREKLLETNVTARVLGEGQLERGALADFYRRRVNESRDFEAAKEKIMEVLPALLHAYVRQFTDVLDGKVHTAGGMAVALFEDGRNRQPLEHVRDAAAELERRKERVQILNYERYQRIRESVEETIESEFPVLHLIEDIRRSLNAIKTNCAALLRENESPPEVREALSYPLAVTYELLLYLADDRTLRERNEEDRLTHEIKRKLGTIERIADAVTYRETRDRFVSLISFS